MPDADLPLPLPEQPPMDDAAGGPSSVDPDAMPTQDQPEDGESAAHPS